MKSPTEFNWQTAFTSDPDKIARNREIPVLYIDSKTEDRGTDGYRGYWQGPGDWRCLSTVKDEQGL